MPDWRSLGVVLDDEELDEELQIWDRSTLDQLLLGEQRAIGQRNQERNALIYRRYAEGTAVTQLSRDFGLSRQRIHQIVGEG